MSCRLTSCFVAWASRVLLLVSILIPSVTSAADLTPNSPHAHSAAEKVEQALKAEEDGDLLARQRLLAEAELASEFAPAKWHRGELLTTDGTWTDVAACMRSAQSDKRLDEYERRRSGLADSMTNHFALAGWCAEQGLFDQCRSHLHRVLAFDTDHARARQALGYRAVGGEWIGPQELSQISNRTNYAIRSMLAFGKELRQIAQRLAASDSERRRVAAKELLDLADPLAVPAAEAILTNHPAIPAQVAIDWFSQIDSVEASQVLARYGLFHDEPGIRIHAAQKLRDRPLHDFMPDLMKMLSSPVSTMIVPVFDSSGIAIGYRQAFSQEKYDKRDFVLFSRVAQTTDAPNFDRLTRRGAADELETRSLIDNLNSAMEDSLRELYANETISRTAAMRQENVQQAVRNRRVAELVSVVAQREFALEPQAMWQWWDDYNQTNYQAFKPGRYRQSSLIDEVPVYNQPTFVASECFVAGTPVATLRGSRAIEQVVVGDSVLSRNVTTGELCWKPVLRSTMRPPELTLRIDVGKEEFQCTAGHLFWVSGVGWQKAAKMKPGDILHAAQDPIVVTSVQPAAQRPTFNLEVADNATYFVGESMVLTHDVTQRRPERQRVPGQHFVSFAAATAGPANP